jgi:hypothetical protein
LYCLRSGKDAFGPELPAKVFGTNPSSTKEKFRAPVRLGVLRELVLSGATWACAALPCGAAKAKVVECGSLAID